MILTDEQKSIIDKFTEGGDLAIEALAGSGKTTILVELGKTLARTRPSATAYYITFNRKNALEVQDKFFDAYREDNAVALTVHALALRSLSAMPQYSFVRAKLNRQYPPKYKVVESFVTECVEYTDPITKDYVYASKTETYNLALDALRVFCMGSDFVVSAKHITDLYKLSEGERDKFANVVVSLARRMWDDITSPDGAVLFLHDYYLKMWSLESPDIGDPGDVILYDEAQDARDCVTSVVFAQRGRQRVVVGDHYQNIYSFMGSTNALRKMLERPGVSQSTLTTSWRFGDGVAQSGTGVLRYIGCDSLTLRGNPGLRSDVYAYAGGSAPLDVDAIIVRSNHEVIDLMMRGIEENRKVHAVINKTEVYNACDDIEALSEGRQAKKIAELKQLSNFQELLDNIDLLSGSSLYKVIVKVTPHGVRHVLDSDVPEEEADVVVSTMHKAKGREWDTVAIQWANPALPYRRESESDNRKPWGDYFSGNHLAELMLLYVAITRGRRTVFIPEDIACHCGIPVRNATDFEVSWSISDFVRWMYSERDIIIYRNGEQVDVPQDWHSVANDIEHELCALATSEDNNVAETQEGYRASAIMDVMFTRGLIPSTLKVRNATDHKEENYKADYTPGEGYGYVSEFFGNPPTVIGDRL